MDYYVLHVLQCNVLHCGIHGNETADFLAKKGTEIKGSTLRKLPLVSAKRLIKNENNKKHKLWINKEGENKSWKNLIETPNIIPELPRKAAVASFRLLTGHDCLNHYLHRLRIKDTPICPLCTQDAVMDAEHIVICPALLDYDNIVGKYWGAREKMT
uniref:RNase H type-1 domain-containing protein n=1 Tax=Cacopsylla melanoneura TaxID=428564 RepID=A0A8D8ULK8_9HEMI